MGLDTFTRMPSHRASSCLGEQHFSFLFSPYWHQVVFRRSAAVSAVAIAAMAKATGRLQTAMGGLTVGIDGSLYTLNPTYRDAVREYLEMILTKKTADLIHTVVAEDGSGKGAAVLAATLACRQS